jgi:hypothetical protein
MGPGYVRALVLLCCLGMGLRVVAVVEFGTWREGAGSYEHAEIARSLARGDGFRFSFFSDTPQASSHQAPAVPFLLAAAYRALGEGTPAAHLAMELLNVALAGAAIFAIAAAASALWWPGIGVAAAALYAVYPPLVYMTTRIQAVNWATTFLLLLLAALLATRRTWSLRAALAAGTAGSLGMLGEPILLAPFALSTACLAVAAWREQPERRRGALRAVAAIALAAAVVLTPWTLRNLAVHHAPVFVKSTFWYVFWQGNGEVASGTDKLRVSPTLQEALAWKAGLAGLEGELEAARQQSRSVDSALGPEELATIRARRSEIERVAWFRDQALAGLAADPMHYLHLCARRLWLTLWFDDTNPRAFALAYRVSYLTLVAAALVGIVLARRERPTHAVLPLALAAGLLTVHTLVITSARFRLPLEALLLLPAALALTIIAGRCVGRGHAMVSPGAKRGQNDVMSDRASARGASAPARPDSGVRG